jgi:hypothetical protein
MSNKHRGYVTIAAGGKDRPLRFSLNAMAELEESLMVSNMIDLLSVDFNSFRVIRTFVITGLMDGDRSLSKEDAMELFRDIDDDIDTLGKVLLEALTRAGIIRRSQEGEEDEKENPPKEKPKSSTGSKPSA